MSIAIRESVSEAPVKNGNRWRAIVARPGQGSSGFYSEDVFRRDAAKIIAPGGHCFINHEDSRNPKDLVGVYKEGAYWDETEKAVVADLTVFSHWESFVNEVGPHLGVSLYAMGEQDDDGNVTAFIEDRLNGADLVARPGLVGSGLAEKLYESAKAQVQETSTTAVVENGNEMELEKVVEALDALTAKVSALVAEKESAVAAEAQVQADAEAVATAVEAYDAAVRAVDEADLLQPQREALLSAAKRGEDIAEAIESAKAVKEAAVQAARVSESAGGRFLGTESAGFDVKVSRW